jgi:transcription elongation factor GreA
MSGDTYLSREGYEKLRAELEYIKTTRRVQISKEIGIARAHGDISENAEYDAAKEAQGLNEKRISELEDKLAGAKIIDDLDIPKDKIYIGATVQLKNLDTGEDIQHTLVAADEVDFALGKISISSPVAKGLLGRKEGDIVEIKVPAGILKYKVLKITR